jgi:NitT/TauT family transport system permease protein
MSGTAHFLALFAALVSAALLGFALLAGDAPTLILVFGLAGTLTLFRGWLGPPAWVDAGLAVLGAWGLVSVLGTPPLPAYDWLALVAIWAFAWLFAERLADQLATGRGDTGWIGLAVPLAFGAMLLLFWEVLVRGTGLSPIILPPPSTIGARFAASLPTLWVDFQQTFLKSVLAGYALGCAAGFIVAILVDLSPFLRRGLLPLGNFMSALPVIGVAPIMVMWFGFDWPSKAAVIVCMTFFPMLVNTVAGLNASGRIERDLMVTYAAGYWQTLFKLRLPQAAPFIFNALKINSTLALIGAIVAEFFGTPIRGMGFRISTEVGKLNIDMVWAEVAVAALAGSLFYGVVALIERGVTFWHPSVRGGRA